jgi:hypothetical protein
MPDADQPDRSEVPQKFLLEKASHGYQLECVPGVRLEAVIWTIRFSFPVLSKYGFGNERNLWETTYVFPETVSAAS